MEKDDIGIMLILSFFSVQLISQMVKSRKSVLRGEKRMIKKIEALCIKRARMRVLRLCLPIIRREMRRVLF